MKLLLTLVLASVAIGVSTADLSTEKFSQDMIDLLKLLPIVEARTILVRYYEQDDEVHNITNASYIFEDIYYHPDITLLHEWLGKNLNHSFFHNFIIKHLTITHLQTEDIKPKGEGWKSAILEISELFDKNAIQNLINEKLKDDELFVVFYKKMETLRGHFKDPNHPLGQQLIFGCEKAGIDLDQLTNAIDIFFV